MTEVTLVDYSEDWQNYFHKEKVKISNRLLDNPVHIAHIGSTAIPRIKAKPILDITLGIDRLMEFEKLISPLNSLGYNYVDKPELVDRKFFLNKTTYKFPIHLHVCEWKNQEWSDKLLFRDFLRKNEQRRIEYESLKVKLAHLFQNNRQSYTEGKTEFILDTLQIAKQELNDQE